MKTIKYILVLFLFVSYSCSNYLDVIPDNVATIDHAFNNRSNAEKYLFTCYNRLPSVTGTNASIGLMSGDEFWFYPKGTGQIDGRLGGTHPWDIARGEQNINSPKCNYWDGENAGKPLYQAIRDCNIFIENITRPRDLQEYERKRWIAEVKFLKAYYHFYLFQLYGPIIIMDENLDVSSPTSEVRAFRDPVDDVVEYIVGLIDEALIDLPEEILNQSEELGRITQPIALAVKAKVLTLAASPLFNGNADFANFKDSRDVVLFPETFDPEKWQKAADASKAAIEAAEKVGSKLYVYKEVFQDLSDSTLTTMSIRQSVTDKWNSEIVWGSTENVNGLQSLAMPGLSSQSNYYEARRLFSPTFRVAEQFYSENGVPIEEDVNYNYNERYKTRIAEFEDRYYIKQGYETANLHFNREPRFYANLGFDGSSWYGNGKWNDDDQYYLEAKRGQFTGYRTVEDFSITGYFAKKIVSPQNSLTSSGFTRERYTFPVIRLADLYLMYAEALNEVGGPDQADVTKYIDLVRERAGLKGVVESWKLYSSSPSKPNSKEGMREIIRQERLNELALEGQRFFDLRRWKESQEWMNKPFKGWNVKEEKAEYYYDPVIIYTREFNFRDYFWPLKLNSLLVNPNLVQNPGW